ncbi:hypothetical protein BV375_27780 [Nostoc sp. 106C]|nr:hypothetical protein BV375_27780 [Nostoc sp. 106C]
MDLLKVTSLVGIVTDGTEEKLTPVSSDVFVSIPDRGYKSLQLMQVLLRPHIKVPHHNTKPLSFDIFNC